MSFRVLLLAIVVSASTFYALAQPHSINSKHWKRFTLTEEQFSIELPAPPKCHPDAQVKGMTACFAYLQTGIVFTIRVGPTPKHCDDVLDRVKNQAQQQSKSSHNVSSVSGITDRIIDGHRIISHGWKLPNGNRAFERYECSSSRLYVITATWQYNRSANLLVKRAIETFRVLEHSSNS